MNKKKNWMNIFVLVFILLGFIWYLGGQNEEWFVKWIWDRQDPLTSER